jgi:hypothetical protein
MKINGCLPASFILLLFFASFGGCLFTLDSIRIEDELAVPTEEDEDEEEPQVTDTDIRTDYENLVSRSLYRSARGPLGEFTMLLDG